jgi:hypothetical protein
MGWLNSHLMQFEAAGRTFGRPDGDDMVEDTFEDARERKLRDVLSDRGDRMIYHYDFGDSWLHDVTLEMISEFDPAQHEYPRCIAGQHAAPAEDCGGPPLFEELKRVLADPEDEDYAGMLRWLDFYYPNYDP